VPREKLRLLEELPCESLTDAKSSRLVMVALADRLSPIRAAVQRSFGFDVVAAGPSSTEAIALGRRDCSGKECMPYQVLWGTFRKLLEESPSEKRTVLLQGTGEGMCRFCVYSIKDQISLQRLGFGDKVVVRHDAPMGMGDQPRLAFEKAFGGTLAWDILTQLVAYYRPLEGTAGDVDRLYDRFCNEVEALLARPSHHAEDGTPVRTALLALVRRASEAFAEPAARAPADPTRRTVYMRVLADLRNRVNLDRQRIRLSVSRGVSLASARPRGDGSFPLQC